MVFGEIVKKLLDLVSEHVFKKQSAPLHTGLVILGPVFNQNFLHLFKCFHGLTTWQGAGLFYKIGFGQVLLGQSGGLGEETFEEIPGPLEGVFDLVGKVLEGADGDALLRRVLR